MAQNRASCLGSTVFPENLEGHMMNRTFLSTLFLSSTMVLAQSGSTVTGASSLQMQELVFDQSRFVKTAIETLLHEGGVGLFLTCLMNLIFLGSMRATIAVFFSIPLSL